MRKTMFGLLALIMVMAGISFAETAKQFQFVDELGRPRTDVTYVYVYNAGTLTASTLYKYPNRNTAVTNPLTPTSTNTTLLTYNGSFDFYDNVQNHDIIANVGGLKVRFENISPQDVRLVVPRSVYPSFIQKKGGYFNFVAKDSIQPLMVQNDGTAASGTDTEVNLWGFPGGILEASNIAAATIIGPTASTSGLNVDRDDTDNDGIEINQGTLATGPAAFKIGTDGPFHFKVKLLIPDVSDTDDCAIGFRNDGAYAPAIDDYTDMAVLNVISGAIYTETILNNAATVPVDTTDTWADAATKTLEVYVSQAGVVTFKINGVAPTVTQAFTFDSGDDVVPFFYFLHAGANDSGICLVEWDCGLDAESSVY